MRKLERLFLLTLFIVGFSISAWAQVERGTLACTVADTTGAGVPGAEITVTNVDTGVEFKTVTNDQGEFVAPNLIPGRYRVIVAHTGFKSLEREDLIMTRQRAIGRYPGPGCRGGTQTVDVRGDVTPLLSKESSTVTSSVETEQVAELPTLNRSIFDLSAVLPGVTVANIQSNSIGIPDNARVAMGLTANGGGSGGSGSASLINNFTLDGVNNTMESATSSYLGINPPLEAIQELDVDTSTHLAEEGRGGTDIRVVLKSGSNKLHGSAFEFLRNAAFDARNYFDYEDLSGSNRRLPNFVQNQPGGTIGGPIRKDKSFSSPTTRGSARERAGLDLECADVALRAGARAEPRSQSSTLGRGNGTTRLPFAGEMIVSVPVQSGREEFMNYMPTPNGGTVNALGIGDFYSSSTLSRDQESSMPRSITILRIRTRWQCALAGVGLVLPAGRLQ